MKKNYYKNIFLSQLNTKSSVEVLKSSLSKIEDEEFLAKIISNLKRDELSDFISTLSTSTYLLNNTSLNTLLHKFALDKPSFLLLKELAFDSHADPKNFYNLDKEFLLNYCYIREQLEDYENFEIFTEIDISTVFHTQSNDAATSFALGRYYQILIKMVFNLKNKKITKFNQNSLKRFVETDVLNQIDSENILESGVKMLKILNNVVKDPLLKSIINENARANSKFYLFEQLYFVPHKQLYNLSQKECIFLQICQENSVSGKCKICERNAADLTQLEAFSLNSSVNINSSYNPSNINDKINFDSPEFSLTVTKLFENCLIEQEMDFNFIFELLLHLPWLRTPKNFKICLKQYISMSKEASKKNIKKPSVSSNYHPNFSKNYKIDFKAMPLSLEILNLFEINEENETIAISFLKASSSYFQEAITAIPVFMKTPKLYFACFICLSEASQKSNYHMTVAKNIISRYNTKFISVINYIMEFVINKNQSESSMKHHELFDKEYLLAKLADLANLFSESVESFYNKNIHYIFNAFYPSTQFTSSFVQSNIKYVVIQKITENSFKDQVDDVDILVGLLFQDYFHTSSLGSNLDAFFKPSANFFIKKNLSHILFKIKNAYSSKLYNRQTCIYKIMRFVLLQVNIPLYFSYIWPYVEFFLNCEYCICAGYFLEWLHTLYDSKLMVPYRMIPFEKIDDLPEFPNIESKVYSILARFFSNKEIPFEYKQCHFSKDIKPSININNLKINNSFKSAVNDKNAILTLNEKFTDKSEIKIFYNSLRDCIQNYSNYSLIDDENFIKKFLINFKNNKNFRNKIAKLNSSKIPIEAKALFGNLKYDENVDSFPKAPSNIPKSILENFLLKINYERQDLFAFTIQEFLKNIDEPFEPEIENFVQQFRHTKFEYKFALKTVESIDFSSFRNFLESLFYLLYERIKKLTFLKYLILFDDSTVEYACLCMIKLLNDNSPSFCSDLFKSIETSNLEILKFLLKINTFVGKPVIGKADVMNYSLISRDFYSLIYCLEDTQNIINQQEKQDNENSKISELSDFDLLQLSYFMIGDVARVKGFNSTVKNFTNYNLFFDFITDKNYNASRGCLSQLEKENQQFKSKNHPSVQPNEFSNSFKFKKRSFAIKILKEIVDCNADFEIEKMISGKFNSHPGVIYHILKDIELLINSKDYTKTIEIINERRSIADNSDLILQAHKLIESKVNLENFSKSVDEEIIRYFIQRKEYLRAEEEISKFLLRKDYSALYELASIKIATKQIDNAKELFKRMQSQCDLQSKEYFKATVKLCELTPSKIMFETGVMKLEKGLCELLGVASNSNEIEYGDFQTQRTQSNSSLNKNALQKLEHIMKDLEETRKNNKIIHENAFSDSQIPNIEHTIELFKNLQKLYFLTAKYFEKHNKLISIKYYFKSFISNQEAIPRFFHLIASSNKTQFKIIGEMIDTIIKEYLPYLLPFYKQISTKIALDADGVRFFKQILYEMLDKYPYQTHWNTLFLYNSKKVEVSKIMNEIVEKLKIDNLTLFFNIKNCSEKLTAIAKSQAKTLSMEDFPEVRNLFPANINVPGQMTEINNIKNEIIIFRSLQMPKRITFVGEDGKDYPMIVKYKDDLRKDSRFMDLDDLLNKLFSESYYIRRYDVIPFTHDSGIIEFLPNLINLKDIVVTVHKNIMETLQRFVKPKMIGGNNMETLEKTFKPVYNNYLKESYKDPYQFYKNRENYIKTYAIMNIVGWYMGLGDRHAENIHFDKITGDTVHVDLNCIFEKGKSLEIPEKVPFRLTQNIIDGFGVLKVEGTYRDTMKYTLELIKENRDVVQANLLSFVFDPLLEWSRKKTEPSKILEQLDNKLDFEDVDLKIDSLIDEARDYNNLGGMYIGWMAFL